MAEKHRKLKGIVKPRGTRKKPHPTYLNLCEVKRKIEEGQFPDTDENRDLIQTFKNEEAQFPWPELEEKIGQFYIEISGLSYNHGFTLFSKTEFQFFVEFIQQHGRDGILARAKNFKWVE